MYVIFLGKYLRGVDDYSKSSLKGGFVRVNLDLRSSQRWLGLAHGSGTWFVVAHGIVPWYCM